MPRRTTPAEAQRNVNDNNNNDNDKEHLRQQRRRSSRLLMTDSKSDSVASASASASALDVKDHNDDETRAASTTRPPFPPNITTASSTLRTTRGRKRTHASSNDDDDNDDDNTTTRKKERTTTTTTSIAAVDPTTIGTTETVAASSAFAAGKSQRREASPNVDSSSVKYTTAPTITPVSTLHAHARTEQDEEDDDDDEEEDSVRTQQNDNLNLLGNSHDLELSRSPSATPSSSSSTTSADAPEQDNNNRRLPEGVIDLYPPSSTQIDDNTTTRTVGTTRCKCKQRLSVANSLTESYLSSYGYDYYQSFLKNQEQHSYAYYDDDDDSSSSCVSSRSSHTYSTIDESHTNSVNDNNNNNNSNNNMSTTITETPRSIKTTTSTTTTTTTRRISRSNRHRHRTIAAAAAVAAVPSIPPRPVLGTSPLVGELEALPCQPHLTPKMRGILIDWLIELAEEYRLTPLTLQLAVSLVDQSLARGPPPNVVHETMSSNVIDDAAAPLSSFFTVQREMLQCVGCACMWIASKWEEVEPPSIEDFVYISDNSYTKEQISDMELTICTALEFRLFQVTPLHFLPEFLRASCACGDPCCCLASCDDNNSIFRHMVLYLLELSLLPDELAHVHASLKAAAAVYLARVTLGIRCSNSSKNVQRHGGAYWTRTLQHYTGYDLSDLEETALTIHRYHRAAEESQFKSVFAKFRTEKYNSVSLKTVPLESDLGF